SVASGTGYAMKYRMRRADGVYRWIDTRAEPVRNQDGTIAQWYVISIDVDDEVRAQQALRDRERELSQLVDIVPVHIRRLTPAGEPTSFTKRLVDFFGLDVTNLDQSGTSRLVTAMQTLVHPDDSARLLAAVRRSFASGEGSSMKYRMLRADGAYRWVDG